MLKHGAKLRKAVGSIIAILFIIGAIIIAFTIIEYNIISQGTGSYPSSSRVF